MNVYYMSGSRKMCKNRFPITKSKLHSNKKVLLRERKRHTACHVACTPFCERETETAINEICTVKIFIMIYELTKNKLYAVVITYFDLKLCSIINII